MERTIRTSTAFTYVEFIQDRFNKIITLSEKYILKSPDLRKLLNKSRFMVCEQMYLYVGTKTRYQYTLIHTS
jgi:hypothetical protein